MSEITLRRSHVYALLTANVTCDRAANAVYCGMGEKLHTPMACPFCDAAREMLEEATGDRD